MTDFNTLLISKLPELRSYAIKLTRTQHAGEDLTQETARRAWEHQGSFQIGTNFSAWIYRILRNEFLTRVRTEGKRRPPLNLDEVPDHYISASGGQEEQVLIKEITVQLSKLTPQQRRVFKLVCLEGLEYEEAAQVERVSVGAIKSQVHRARARIRAQVIG